MAQENFGDVLAHLCAGFRVMADAGLRALGLYAGQEQILFHLWRQEGLTLSQLTERQGCSAPTITNSIQRLGRSGLVTRRPDPKDARVVHVYLTEQGRALETPVRALWSHLEEELLVGIRPTERILLHHLLTQMRQNTNDRTGIAGLPDQSGGREMETR